MVNCAGSSPEKLLAEPGAGGGATGAGTATARVTGMAARATGVSEGPGKAVARRMLAGVSLWPADFALPGFFDCAPLLFLFFVGALSDSPLLDDSGSGVCFALGLFGVASPCLTGFFFFFFPLLTGDGDLCGVGDGDGVFFGFAPAFFFGRGVGDPSVESEESDCSCFAGEASARRRFCSSLTWARTSVAMSALIAIAVIHRVETRATAADRNRRNRAFKLAARPAAILRESNGGRGHAAEWR